jgi:hypothetical protein
MFHYRCLLVESGCWECGRCRNSPPFATKCPTRATCHRKCHILPQSAAFCLIATLVAPRAASFRGRNRDSRSASFHLCIANRESSPITWLALFNNRAWRHCTLAMAEANACPTGSGMQVSRILARLSTNVNKACCDRSRRVISRLICSRLARVVPQPRSLRLHARLIYGRLELSIAALRKTLGL